MSPVLTGVVSQQRRGSLLRSKDDLRGRG